MKAIRTLFSYALFIVLILGAYSGFRPYWNKYWIQKDMQTAAIYGTKNTKEDTLAFLVRKMRQEGRFLTEQVFFVEKDQNKNVTITLHYKDQIGLFGIELKALHFTVTASASEIKEYY